MSENGGWTLSTWRTDLGAFEQRHVEVRHARRADLPFVDEPRHLQPRVLDGRADRVGPVELVEVDALDAEAPERRLDLAPDRVGAQVALGLVVWPVAVRDHAALREDERPLRGGYLAERAADDLLGVAEAVDGRGIDPVHAAADGVADRGDRARVVLGPQPYAQPPPPIAHAPNPTVVISRSVVPSRRFFVCM